MPAPAVYVLAVVGAVGAVIAFKEFVYEPVIAPRVERWAAEYLAKREAKRRRLAEPIPVSLPLRRRRRRSDSLSSDTDSDEGDDSDKLGKGKGKEEEMQERELLKWRNGVVRSGSEASQGGLNLRKRTSTKHSEQQSGRSYTPLSPSLVHVIIDPSDSSSSPPTPTSASQSTFPSRVSTPPSLARVSSLQSGSSSSPQHGARSTTFGRTPSPDARSTTLGRTPSPPVEAPANVPTSAVTPNAANVNATANAPHTPAISELTGLDFTSPPMPVYIPSSNPSNTNLLSPSLSHSSSSTSPFGSYTSTWSTQTETPTPTVENPHPSSSSSPFYAQTIPSLSQIYPQELDAERGIELVSPPSSRSESPFVEVDGESVSGTSSSSRVLSPLGFERVRSPLAFPLPPSQQEEGQGRNTAVPAQAYQSFSPAPGSASPNLGYTPTSPQFNPTSSGTPTAAATASGNSDWYYASPRYSAVLGNTGNYSPTSPVYSPTAPTTHLSFTSPTASPAPGYVPRTPNYFPTANGNGNSSARYSPTARLSTVGNEGRPESPWTSASASAAASSAPRSGVSSPNMSPSMSQYYSLHNSSHSLHSSQHSSPSLQSHSSLQDEIPAPPIDYPRSESTMSSRLSDVDYLDDLESVGESEGGFSAISGVSGVSSAREGMGRGNGRDTGMGGTGRGTGRNTGMGSESGSDGWMDDF